LREPTPGCPPSINVAEGARLPRDGAVGSRFWGALLSSPCAQMLNGFVNDAGCAAELRGTMRRAVGRLSVPVNALNRFNRPPVPTRPSESDVIVSIHRYKRLMSACHGSSGELHRHERACTGHVRGCHRGAVHCPVMAVIIDANRMDVSGIAGPLHRIVKRLAVCATAP
jgi:hypothetical protein